MKTLVVGLLTSAVVVTGCSSSGHAKTPKTSLDSSAARQVYLSTVRPLFPSSESDDDLIRLSTPICSILKAGGTYSSLIAQYTNAGQDPTKIGKLVASSVIAFCPKYLPKLPGGTDYP